jgi:hypothetical protein
MQPAYQCSALEARDEEGPVNLRLSGPRANFSAKKEAKLANEALHDEEGLEGTGEPRLNTESTGKIEDNGKWRRTPHRNYEPLKQDDPAVPKGKAVEEDRSPFPPRKVAVHRVMWNPNKRYGLWLAWGGQAGLVCCQRVRLPQYDMVDKRT